MLPTPDLSHLTRKDYENIYEPSEDTFILLDALEKDVEFLKEKNPRLCLEIGSGSGCISTFLAKAIGDKTSLYCCTDINPYATSASRRTGQKNGVQLDIIQGSLASNFLKRCNKQVDILMFNPPYVPTDLEEAYDGQAMQGLSGAWAGGQDGMDITNRVLCQVDDLLSPSGSFYLVAVSQNKPKEVMKRMREEYGFEAQIILARKAGREHLHVLRFCRERIIG
ncbi:S-adenosyl-L-methionine-dependent methyltransferase [Serendipita vermifera]|nr:S-adenosyl-L-methionine-dependent methyltransferase [Serendipita vermifera]